MCELAAHLVDGVFGDLPVRQWVLTLPHRLRYALAYDHRLCRAVLGVFVRAVLSSERRRAGVHRARGRGGAVTAIQRCGSALNANVHFHTVAAQGAFEEQADGSRRASDCGFRSADCGVSAIAKLYGLRVRRHHAP